MKAKTLLLAGALTACSMDNALNPNSPTYEEELCMNNLSEDVIPSRNFSPSSFPLDVSEITDDGVFMELLSGFREDIFAITAVQNADGTYSYYNTAIFSATEDFEFSEHSLIYENGDYQISVDFGGIPTFETNGMELLISNQDCNAVYGYAEYYLKNDYTNLVLYMNENGDLVYL